MPFEISEQLVSLAYQSLGYFVIEGLNIGNREVDLLAIRLGKDGRIAERKHIEVHISVRPIGVIGHITLKESNRDPAGAARGFVARKFEHPRVVEAVRAAFGDKPYEYVLVHGVVMIPSQLDVLRGLRVNCVDAWGLIREAYRRGRHNHLHRVVEIAERIAEQSAPEGDETARMRRHARPTKRPAGRPGAPARPKSSTTP